MTRYQHSIVESLLIGSGSCVALYVCGLWLYGNSSFWFLLWNLFLAWLPLIFAWELFQRTRTKNWLNIKNGVIGLLWLGFLPNSFYIVSDFVHMRYIPGSNAFFYSFMIMAFALNGLVLGYLSVYLIHARLLKVIKPIQAHTLIGLVFLACSFAIYLGRIERWNTWDVLINPAGLLFDVSDPLLNPVVREQVVRIMTVIFIFLSFTYAMGWRALKAARAAKP